VSAQHQSAQLTLQLVTLATHLTDPARETVRGDRQTPGIRLDFLPSDHHASATRRYQTLRSRDGAPNLPRGYASMIGLTYFPPLWRKVMDHRVLAHYDGDITRVNIHPRVRNKVLARYGESA